MSDAGLKVRFELSRAQLELAQAEAAAHAADFESFARDGQFDTSHLLGRVHFDVALPFEADPVLEFLKDRRGLNAAPPLTISLDQPVAHLIGQLAGAAVLTLHGEGARLVPLTGGKGAIGLDASGDVLLLSLPLDAYAGSIAVPAPQAALAFAEACASLQAMLREHAPALSGWSLLAFLRREERILRAVTGAHKDATVSVHAATLPETLDVARFALRGAPSLVELAGEAEQSGAHVVPYWDIRPTATSGALAFFPIQRAGPPSARGALARLIFPGTVRTIEADVGGNESDTARLRSRLSRPAAFDTSIDPAAGRLGKLREADGALPLR